MNKNKAASQGGPRRPEGGRLKQATWLLKLHEIGRAHGFFEKLGAHHTALYVEEGDTLVVSFDDAARVLLDTEEGLPLGFGAVHRREWSLLSIMAFGRTWFRDADIWTFFDKLIDSGFFDSFENVVFLGAGPMAGYAAAAYSIAAPEATVIAISPVATLDPAAVPFERRFRTARRLNFTDRYGYAPDMVSAADAAYILYDPLVQADAAHAAMFRGPNVTHLPIRHGGTRLLDFLEHRDTTDLAMRSALENRLTPERWGSLTRSPRRSDPGYLKRLMARADATGHPKLARVVARFGTEHTEDPAFARRLAATGPAVAQGQAMALTDRS